MNPMMQQRAVGGYQGYGADPRDEMARLMAEKEANYSPSQSVDTSAPNYGKLDRDSAYYQSMLNTGMDYSPTNFTGGLARLANAFVGRQGLNKVEGREEEYAAQEAAAEQAQKDKYSEMVRAMVGPDANPQMAAMAEMYPEEFAKSRFDMDVNAAKPVKQEQPGYFTETVMENGSPVEYEFQKGNPDYKRRLGAGVPPRALVNVNTGDGAAPTFGGLADGAPIPESIMDLSNTAEWKAGKLPFKDSASPTGVKWLSSSGSTAEEEAAEAERKRIGRQGSTARAGSTVIREVNRGLGLLDQIYGDEKEGASEQNVKFGLGSVAGASWRMGQSMIPGTAEYTFKRNIASARSNIGLDRLQEARDNSPTGGALGQVPVQQQIKLEETIGAIDDLGLPRAYLEENLRYANNAYLDIVYGTPAQRADFVARGIITPEDNDFIDAQYDGLGYDGFGNFMLGGDYTRPVVGMTMPDGQVISEEDIMQTMQENNMSRVEVEAAIRKRMR